ncbi:outer membrane protein [Methylobacterium nigriterrae]|uniref:outer membrane protein n=1 Tax=Methylobacterium nigriterrae TaxID=3127512 RepID=UPI0030136796
MIKTLLLASVASLALVGAAAAADLPPPAPPPIPIFTWTGFYVGVNAGGAFSVQNNRNVAAAAFAPVGTFAAAGPAFAATSGTFLVPAGFGSRNNNTSAFAGGGQIGYNFQSGAFVWGFETDIQGLTSNNNRRGLVGVAAAPFFTRATGPGLPPGAILLPRGVLGNLDWYGTFRGRLGYAINRSLLYVTGGLAYGQGSLSSNFCSNGLLNCDSGNIRTGYAVGGGFEYAVTNNWTARVEGMYMNLSNNRRNNTGVGLGVVAYDAPTNSVLLLGNGNRNNNGFGVVRAAFNYKFGTY